MSLSTVVSFVFYFLAGAEIFINLPINLKAPIGKDTVVTYGSLLTVAFAVLMTWMYTLPMWKALSVILIYFVVLSYVIPSS